MDRIGRTAATAIALGAIVALIALNHLAFARWGATSYLGWYVANGATIGFLSALFGAAWGTLDRHTGLISAHPLEYAGAALQLVGLPIVALGEMVGARGDARRGVSLDRVLATLLGLALTVGLLAWLVVVAPLQYVVFLVCGAPAREALRAARRPLARFDGGALQVRSAARDEKTPEGWWDAGLGQKPFAFTSLVQGFGFFVWKLVGA